MSRGPGRLQRYIYEQLQLLTSERREHTAISISTLTRMYAASNGVPKSEHLRYAMRRAAWSLAYERAVSIGEIKLPTRFYLNDDGEPEPGAWRWLLCVWPADVELTDAMCRGAFELTIP